MPSATPNKRHTLWVLLAVLIGLELRAAALWWGQGYFYFGQGDGVLAYSVAVDYGKGDARAQYIGQPNYNEKSKVPGPLWTLFCWVGLKVGGSIQGAMVLMLFLNVGVIYLVYLLANRMLGPPASLWAALLAATLPSAVFYSTGVYNPEVMPFLAACLCLALWRVVRCERSRAVFWAGLLLLAMPQFHMSGVSLWPAVALVLFLSPTRLNKGWLAAGFVAGMLLYVPYLRGDMAAGWQNTRGMFSGGGHFSFEGFKALVVPFNLLLNWVPQWSRSFADYRDLGHDCFGWFGVLLLVNILSLFVTAALTFGVFRALRAGAAGFWRGPRAVFARAPGLLLPAILLLVPLVCAVLLGQPFHARYGLVLLPPLLVLAGAGVAHLLNEAALNPAKASALNTFRKVFFVALVVMTCANVWLMAGMYLRQGSQIEAGPAFVPSFRQLETVYRQLKRHAGQGHTIRIDDLEYYNSLTPAELDHYETWMLRFYVSVREKERGGLEQGTETIYKLQRAEQVTPGSPPPAYKDHGLALVPVR
jgi:hypothetical protein